MKTNNLKRKPETQSGGSLKPVGWASDRELRMEVALRAADAMARICDDWVKRGIIGSRSALADARLNYGQPFEYEWSGSPNAKVSSGD